MLLLWKANDTMFMQCILQIKQWLYVNWVFDCSKCIYHRVHVHFHHCGGICWTDRSSKLALRFWTIKISFFFFSMLITMTKLEAIEVLIHIVPVPKNIPFIYRILINVVAGSFLILTICCKPLNLWLSGASCWSTGKVPDALDRH